MSASPTERIAVCSLGRVEYERAWELQRRVQGRLIAAKRQRGKQQAFQSHDKLPHVLLLLEHPPVYTLGKSGHAENLLASEEALDSIGATFQKIDRGGDITYHGPGQLVGYPILDLGRFFTDIHRYLRTLEDVIIRTCADYGIEGRRVEGRTGVWVGAEGRERKICAMGIRCSRWVTMHGFALNVHTDLSHFAHIVPCGISDRDVTSISAELGREVDEPKVRERLVRHFGEAFEASTEWHEGEEAKDLLEALVDAQREPDQKRDLLTTPWNP